MMAALTAGVAVFAGVGYAEAEQAKPASGGGKKLLIYVMAGQSNMQGHAEVSTLAYLPKPPHVPTAEEWAMLTPGVDRDVRLNSEPSIKEELMKDPANSKLPKKEFGELVQKALKAEADKVRAEKFKDFKGRQTDPARIARDKELAAIFTPGITDQKVLEVAAAAKTLKGAVEIADLWQSKLNLPVGKHTYVAAYGGVNRGAEPGLATGPLSTGFGARPTAFGPEYAFGILLERQLNQPILIIKTAWGGKSLHYDFRPPSAGAYEPTSNEKNQLKQWQDRKAAWDQYIAGGGTAEAMAKIDKEAKGLDAQKRTAQQAMAKLPPEQQADEKKKIAEMDARIKELRQKLVPFPGDMPKHEAAGFYWNEMTGFIRKVLADPKAYHPEYDPSAGYEVAGGVWFQGFNDQFDPEYYGNYASNMVHYIQDLRKEVKQPRMPFVIGVLGTPAFREEALSNNVAKAQREAAMNPELADSVKAIESWPLTTPEVSLWRMKKDALRASGNAKPEELNDADAQWILHGSNLGYHYEGSGRFFIRLGDEMASTMIKLMGRK